MGGWESPPPPPGGRAKPLPREAVAMGSRFDATGRSLSSELAELRSSPNYKNWIEQATQLEKARDAALAKAKELDDRLSKDNAEWVALRKSEEQARAEAESLRAALSRIATVSRNAQTTVGDSFREDLRYITNEARTGLDRARPAPAPAPKGDSQ